MSSILESELFMKTVVNDEDGDRFFMFIKCGEIKRHDELPSLPFTIIIIEGSTIYSGTITGTDLENVLSNLKIEENQYYSHINNALFTDDKFNYAFKIEKVSAKDLRMKVSMKTNVNLASVKIHLCTVTLQNKEVDVFKNLFTDIISNFNKYDQKINDLENECTKLRKLQDETKRALISCTAAKDTWEKDIYSKFACVVNEKKAIIRSYRENMVDCSSSSNNNNVKETKRKTTEEPTSSSKMDVTDDDEVSFAEDEQYVIQVTQTRTRRRGPTKKDVSSNENEEKMNVPKDDPESIIPQTSSIKTSPDSPPVIRKPAPKRKTRRSARKLDSEENVDAENLLEFL